MEIFPFVNRTDGRRLRARLPGATGPVQKSAWCAADRIAAAATHGRDAAAAMVLRRSLPDDIAEQGETAEDLSPARPSLQPRPA